MSSDTSPSFVQYLESDDPAVSIFFAFLLSQIREDTGVSKA